jgi:hypothetical protein
MDGNGGLFPKIITSDYGSFLKIPCKAPVSNGRHGKTQQSILNPQLNASVKEHLSGTEL